MIIDPQKIQPYLAQRSERRFLVIATCFRNDRIIRLVEANIWEHVVKNPADISFKKFKL